MSQPVNKKKKRIADRVQLEEPLTVKICSIGDKIKYRLSTQDISLAGFFLNFENPKRFPFTGSSIIEVWVELEQETLFFNGKIMRTVYGKEEGLDLPSTYPGIGVQIVQIDQHNQNLLRKFISNRDTADGVLVAS